MKNQPPALNVTEYTLNILPPGFDNRYTLILLHAMLKYQREGWVFCSFYQINFESLYGFHEVLLVWLDNLTRELHYSDFDQCHYHLIAKLLNGIRSRGDLVQLNTVSFVLQIPLNEFAQSHFPFWLI